MEQSKFPLLRALESHVRRIRHRFHLPAGAQPGWKKTKRCYRYELTELSGLDNLGQPEGPIREAQNRAANFFGAYRTFFLVNGSTGGIAASLGALCSPGEKVVLPRNIHRSAVAGLILSGADPQFVPVETLPAYGLPLNVAPAYLQKLANFQAAVITSPSYEGALPPLSEFRDIIRSRGAWFIVDEAHGGHLGCHSDFPPGAQEGGADLWINSAHKTMGALTPGGYLHVGNSHLDGNRLKFYLNMMQTSSPSYPVLASLEIPRQISRREWDRCWELAHQLRKKVESLSGFSCLSPQELPENYKLDPLRVTILLEKLSLDGYQVGELLRERYRIEVEMTADRYLVLTIQPGLRLASVKALGRALKEISRDYSSRERWPSSPNLYQHIPPARMSPREAVGSAWQSIPWGEARGEIAASSVSLFPPGIPLLFPGEEVTAEGLEEIERAVQAGRIQGLNQGQIPIVDR